MGKILVIKGADFSAVAVGRVEPIDPTGSPVITISTSGSVTIACVNATAIYYTTNGSTPTTSSTKYTGASNVSSGTTVKAIAEFASGTTSSVVSKTYSGSCPAEKTYTRSELDALSGENGKYTSGGSITVLSNFNYRVIPASGYSKITISGNWAMYVMSFLYGSTPSSSTYISEEKIAKDAVLSNQEFSIPSGTTYIAVNLFTVSSKMDQVVKMS